MSDLLILDAIKNLIEGKKKLLIPNAILTLKSSLSKACEYEDFYRIDKKYAEEIINDSKDFLPKGKKEEILKKFNISEQNPPNQTESENLPTLVDKNIVIYEKIANPKPEDNKPTPKPISLQSSDPNLVGNNVIQLNVSIQNPIIWRKEILCTVCKQSIEEDIVIYISGYPYHFGCIKCMNCHKTYDPPHEKLSNYICVTPGLFLCRDHYDAYQSSGHLSSENSEEYHQRNKENFVNDLFNDSLRNEIVFEDDQSEYSIITPDLVEDVIPLKSEIEDFVPTVTFHFDKSPTEIDFDYLLELFGDEAVILGVEKGSTILKIAFLSIKSIGEKIHGKIKELIEKFKGKLSTSIGKSVVGNIIEEPEVKLPDDKVIQEKYNQKSQNLLQNTHELNEIELKDIKEEVLRNLPRERGKKNWSFIFQHSTIYERLETQIRDDIKDNPFELIIVGQTIIANKSLDNYASIEKMIPKYNQRQPFLYHGTNQSNHQKIVDNGFLDPNKDKIEKKTDSGYYGKGIYATDDIFYASKYANSYTDLDFYSKAYVICCMTIYNSNFCVNVKDKSFHGQKIDDRIIKHYGAHHALVGSSTYFWPIEETEKDDNYIAAHEFVFANKAQIVPLYSFTVMRTDHFILWKNEDIESDKNKKYFDELSKRLQVNLYRTKTVEESLKLIKKKKRNMFKLITSGGGIERTGETLIREARKIIGANFVCFVFDSDASHYNWVKNMENVLFSSSEDDLRKFSEVELKEEKIVDFALCLERNSEYVFGINRSQLLNFPTTNRSLYK